MATRYIYNNKKYTSTYSLRQAIWKNEHKCYGEPKTQEEFDKCGLAVTLEEYDPIDEMTDEELSQRIRSKRDMVISRTDFYVQPDYPSTPEGLEEVKTYRQTLRDIPEQSGFPRNVTWPEEPSVLRTGTQSALKLAKASGLAKVGI